MPWVVSVFARWNACPSQPDWVSDLLQSRRRGIRNGSKPYRSSGHRRTPQQNIRAAWRGGFFPPTPALSLGERVKPALPGTQSRTVADPLREARCSLSLRERVRVRGTGANYPPAHRTLPGTVELIESSGIAGGLPKWRIMR